MKNLELNKTLDLHERWLNNKDDGVRANLAEADLSRTYLAEADLREASLSGANLYEANLYGANLSEAELDEADLCGADMREANLCRAILCEANLYGVDMRGADLYEADLYGANLYGVDLSGADLSRTDLRGANLHGVNLSGATNIPFIPYACPEKGEFVAFKKCGEYIIELLIPADAKRCSGTTRECRASYAKVLSITTILGKPAKTTGVINTNYSPNVIYKVGEFVYPDAFDEDRWNEFSHGIHFFINRQEAVES